MADLRIIAEERYKEPLNTWPDHNSYHRRTILGNSLFDEECLRCWLELVASENLTKERQMQTSAKLKGVGEKNEKNTN